MKRTPWTLRALGIATLMGVMLTAPSVGSAQGGSRTFPETGKTVSGQFLDYWNTHGALAQQGFPISNEMQEKSDLNGQTYTVQYFERAVFEKHPENAPPFDVLLSQLGTYQYKAKYGANGAQGQVPNNVNGRYFPETKHTIGGSFRTYWEQHGGLAQQGFPISDEFQEKSDLNGQTYTVQYFERAVFEKHPENQPPFDVLLSQLGTFQYKAKYQGGGGNNPPPTQPPANNGPKNKDANVTPYCGVAGTQFTYFAQGFTPNEALSFWFTAPNGGVVGTSRPAFLAPGDGKFQFPIPTSAQFAQLPGWWAMTWAGDFSKHQSVGYFYVARNAGECAGVPAPQNTSSPPQASCDTSGSKDGKAEPASVQAGHTVRVTAWNFTPNEGLSLWFTAPNGSTVGTARPSFRVPGDGGFYLDIPTQPSSDISFSPGRWAITFEGASSHHQSVIFFCVTP
jgi:hypothetical protein